ncbi:MAG: proprotein convertase P-domain-containing protein [Saprospiraceae bacterium]
MKDKLAPVMECADLILDCNADLNDPEILKPAPFISQPAAPFQVPQNILPHGGGAITVAGNALPGGFLFDLQNLSGTPVLITSVDVRFGDIQFGAVTSPTPVSVYVTTTADTWNGNQLDPNAWTNIVFEEPVVVAGPNSEFSNVPLGAGLTLAPGEKRGVFVFGVNNSLLYDGGGTSTLVPFTDGNLELISGVSLGGLFSGASFGPPRTPNIVFHYEERLDGVDPYDNCGTFTLTHFDDFVDGSCGGPSGVLTRTWTATDNSGNAESCTQTITLARPSLDDIEIPGNIKWTCTQYDIFPNIIDPTAVHPYIVDCDAASALLDATCYSASCDDLDFSFQDNAGINSTTTGGGCPGLGLDDADVLALTGSGEPTVDGRPLISICEIGVEHEDIVVQECVGTFKIVRQWTIIDWCSNPIAVRQENQIIKVVDDEAPIIELFGVDGNTNSAYGNNLIPALGNLGNPSTTGGCGQAPQNAGGTVFTALVQLPGTGNQFNPDQFTNISLESVLLTINHQHVEDLDIFLKGPSNKVIELTSDNGINGIGYHKTKFVDDTSVPVISNGVNSPFTGRYRPEGTFDISCGGFNGTVATLAEMTSNWQADVLGTWELIVFDDNEDNIGELVEWKLNFSFGDVTLDVYDATATGSVHTICEGSVLVPPIQDCEDNCSGVDHYITELWTINGGAPEYQIGTINGNGGYFSNVPLFVNGLPARYIVRYYAIDGCKNQSSLDMNVRLRDRVPPVAICDEITEIALTNNGQGTGSSCSRLYPEDLDDGSYDNCSPIYFLMAKMSDSFSQDIYNRCYYPWRDFCDDVGTNM